jgi:TatD DNase family protein
MLIDSHAHLTCDTLYPQIHSLLDSAHKAEVEMIINICTCPKTLERGMQLKETYPWIYNVAATTPHDVEKEGEEVFPHMEKAAREGSIVAVGETGLDYYYEHSNREIQQEFLKRYLRLALECSLPVVIHCRDAFKDFFRILDEHYLVDGKHGPGILHCFTGTLEEAQEVINRNWYLSLSGIATYKKSEELRRVAKEIPLNRLLIETDSPYLAPQKKRGKVNEPAFISYTAEVLAEVRGMSTEELARQTSLNAKRVFFNTN